MPAEKLPVEEPAPAPAPPPGGAKPTSERQRAAALRNLQKAWEASRAHWEKTPARLASSRRTIQFAQAALRGRPRRMTPRQLAALRRNAARARAALARRGRTPEHLARLRETIRLARAARDSASYALHNRKILKHGMYVRSVRDTLRALGDNPGRLDHRVELLRRFFNSTDPREDALIHVLARKLWRHERLYYAQAEWENWRLDRLLASADPAPEVGRSAEDLTFRAFHLYDALLDNRRFVQLDDHMMGSIKRLLRRLLRGRLEREPKF